MSKEKLFSEFPPMTAIEWKKKIEQDLQGKPFEKLIWKTLDGIDVQPFYTEKDIIDKKYHHSLLMELEKSIFPNNWEIREDILVDTIEGANQKALQALDRGATSIAFIIPDDKKLNEKTFSSLLNGIYIDCIQLNFLSDNQAGKIFDLIEKEVAKRGIDSSRIHGSISQDPIGYLSKTGNFYRSEKQDFEQAAGILKSVSVKFPNLRTIGINISVFHNAGASGVQELGLGLSAIAEYLLQLTGLAHPPSEVVKAMQLNISTGPAYFMEIAKIRAFRLLFARLVNIWGVPYEDTLRIFIHSSTSGWAQTAYDSYTNILRSTTQSMSAVLGGVNSLSVIPFDKSYRKSTSFSERIARNTQIILKEEAYFDKVNDPSAGSYFIESLTDSLIKHGWNLFLKIEDEGGYLKAFKAGIIQKMIRDTASDRDMNIALRKDIIVGINKYQDLSEKFHNDFDAGIAFPEKIAVKNAIAEPLSVYRGASAFEELRMRSERYKSGIPKVFLLTIGSHLWRKARAEFSAGFFACAGFDVIDNPGLDTIEEGIKSANSIRADIVVLCSSDEEYEKYGPEAFKKVPSNVIFVIAGYPKDIVEKLKDEGIINYIHRKSNVLEELRKYQELLGIL